MLLWGEAERLGAFSQFWTTDLNWDLAQPDNQSGINALIKVHEQNAAGPTQVLFVDDDLYIMQRPGLDN